MEAGQQVSGPSRGGLRGKSPWSPAWLQRANTTLILIIVLGGMGFAFRTLSKRYAEDLRVPGIYVKIRPEGGGTVEARAAPAPARHAGGPTISMEVTLADVASLVRLIEEVSRVRIVLPCPVERRVSLRVRGAPVGNVLEAVAAAANLALSSRDGTYTLSACVAAAPKE